MAKKIVQDVLPPERRSIRNIPLSGSKTRKREPVKEPTPEKARPEPSPRKATSSKGSSRNYTRITIWTIAILCVSVLAYFFSFLFVSATVTIIPKQQVITADSTLNAVKNSQEGSLSYTTISISKDGVKAVPSKGEEKVEKKATGKIIIYNNYSSAPQALIKNTRFETPDGLIFRINEAVKVPGYTKTNTILLPGFVKVTVTADQPGEKYNVGLADFTIPGFKGDPKYKGFTAIADPATKIGGGFSGIINKVTDADKLSAKNEIEASLKTELLGLAKAQIPDTHILFDEMTSYSFEQLPQTTESGNLATIKEKGTIYGVILSKDELAKLLADKKLSSNDSSNLFSLKNLGDLKLDFKNRDLFFSKSTETANLFFSGSFTIAFDPNSNNAKGEGLAERLAGKKRSEINTILGEFSSIEKAEIILKPFWSLSFPKDSNKIRIKVLGSQ